MSWNLQADLVYYYSMKMQEIPGLIDQEYTPIEVIHDSAENTL